MFGLDLKFYDNYWNFDNKKFIELLAKANKASKDIKASQKKKSLNFDINLFNWVSKKEVWSFINKFSMFINSWIDIKATLWILIKQTKNPYFKDIVTEMKENIDHWVSIHESMQRHPKVFDNLVVALIAVWEKTWQLWRILSELDTTLLENIELKWKIRSALIYPIVLLSLTIAMVTFMMVFIVPKIIDAFLQTWAWLPWLTQLIVNVSNFIISDWYIIVFSIVWAFVIIHLIKKTYVWKMFFAIIATKMPVYGHVVKQSNIIYFIRSFTLLLDSWILLLESLKTSSNVVPNLAYKRELIRIKNEVELWLTISKSLWLNTDYEETVYMNPLFPEDFAYVVNTWEETWSISLSLKKIWINYNLELKRYIWNLATLMEPFIIVLVWWLVGTIVVWIMLPFFQIWEVIKDL